MGGGQWAGGSVAGLVEAVRKGRPRPVQLLLEAGVEVNAQDHTGEGKRGEVSEGKRRGG